MREILRQLSYLFSRREKRNSAILFVMMLVGSVFEVVGVGAIPAFISVISMPERLLEMPRVRWAYDALGLASPRDMVFWDNRSLMHLAAGCPEDQRRKLYRTTIEGDRPF